MTRRLMYRFRICFAVLLCICLYFIATTVSAHEETGQVVLTAQERQWLNDNSSVSVAFDGYFPPYSFIDERGELAGFSVDLFKQMGQRLGITFTPHAEYKWKDLYQSARNKEVDIVATLVNRPERAEWFSFTSPYINKSLVIITRSDSAVVKQKDDLKNAKVALVSSYQYAKRVVEEYPSATPVYVDTMLDAFNLVSTGEVDAAISFFGAGHFIRNKYLLSNLKYAAIYDKNSSSESIGVNKDLPMLVSILEKTLASFSAAEMLSLREKWLLVNYIESNHDVELTQREVDWISNHKVIRVGIDPEFIPFEFIEDGKYQGIASDYIKLLSERLNLNFKIEQGLTWKEVIEKSKKGEIDLLPAVALNKEREAFLTFTRPYLNFHRVIVTRNDADLVLGINDFDGKTVAVQSNTSHHGVMKSYSGIKLNLYKTQEDALLALSGGKEVAFIGNVASISYWIRKLHLSNLKIAAPVSDETSGLHFGVSKNLPELRSILEKGLASISLEEEKAISEKWLSIEYDPVTDYTLILKIALAFLLVLSAFIFWNFALNRKVQERTKELVYSANYDRLTGLPNRFLIQDRLEQRIIEAAKEEEQIAILSMDINNFKKLNDTLGHLTADRFLKEIAERLRKSVEKGDSLGRVSGDQFIILLSNLQGTDDTIRRAKKILKLFKAPFIGNSRTMRLSASIGIAFYPLDGETAAELLQNAISTTNDIQARSPGTYGFFCEEISQKVSRQADLEEQMAGALERGEFYLTYQPQVLATNGEIIGFEALLRWNNRELGHVSPMEFIPVAESNCEIEAIGNFVIREAIKQQAVWQSQFNSPYLMSVNISPAQFSNSKLVTLISDTLTASGISPEHLELEITEGVLLNGDQKTDSMLNELVDLNIRLALDDFGTGYSSMSYLRKYPFDTLKIDREFVNELPENQSDKQLVVSTIAMSHSLGLKVVAEGVETQEQSDFLLQQNCDILQGWLYGKPLPADDITEQLREVHSIAES